MYESCVYKAEGGKWEQVSSVDVRAAENDDDDEEVTDDENDVDDNDADDDETGANREERSSDCSQITILSV